jgi:hypothetical protein
MPSRNGKTKADQERRKRLGDATITATARQGAAPKVKAAKPAMLCHGGAWLVEACLVVIPGWQMAVHG